nr:hypothetical protein [uncultured Psychroserpens sp.]
MVAKILLIGIGLILSLVGAFYSYGILLYTGKESDDSASYFVIIPILILFLGVYLIRKGIILKRHS